MMLFPPCFAVITPHPTAHDTWHSLTLTLDSAFVRPSEGSPESPCFMEWAFPHAALRRSKPVNAVPRSEQARYLTGLLSRGARPQELLLRLRPGEESAELGQHA